MVKRALTDPHTQSVTAVIYGAQSKLNSKPTELHGNASIDFTELRTCDCRQLHRTGKHQTCAQEELPAVCQGSISEDGGCAVPCRTAEQSGSAFPVLQCVRRSESWCNLTVAGFPVNFRPDQIFTNFLATAWWWHSGPYSFRFDMDHLYLIHTYMHILCYR